MAIRRMALISHTILHWGFSSRLLSLCSRAALSSWDRLGVGLVGRPQNHMYNVFHQGCSAVREGDQNLAVAIYWDSSLPSPSCLEVHWPVWSEA